MFDQIFSLPHVINRYRVGALAEERLRYLAHCAEEQMSRWMLRTIARYTLIAAGVLRLDKRPGAVVSRGEVKAKVDRWLACRSRRSTDRQVRRLGVRFTNHVVRWLAFLGRLRPTTKVQQPYADHLSKFLDSARERGLSPQTIATYDWVLRRFLAQIANLRLQALTVVQLDKLLIKQFHDDGYARHTVRKWASVLRAFLRFAEDCGWCRQGLAAAIMAPRVYAHQGLPIGPSWDDVKRLLATTERPQTSARGRACGIRDRALLLLLAMYGLRAAEVATLRVDDFDWERETLNVPHGKGQRPRTYPLCHSVGDAVLRYLREVRPRSGRREVFLTLVPPFRPLSSSEVGTRANRWLHRAGLILPHYGSHILRHACASHLLAQGLSLKEIGDHLGHQSPETTRIYAKVDLTALRVVGDFSLEGLL